MATETYARSGKARWYPRWAPRLLVGVIVVCVLALVLVEVVAPLRAGLPIGWGQYNNSQFHLHIGTPPFWNVVGDSGLTQGAINNCTLAVVASPLSGPALRTTLDAMKAPRWMGVSTCDSGMGADTQSSLWTPVGQTVVVAGQREPVQMETVGAPQVSDRVVVSLHGFTYFFMLQDPSAAQAQQDLADFLTFIQSFRYTS